jgi:ATP-dependent helicase/nuclease subunit A
MRESDLFELCYSRKGTVFESLHQYQDKEAQVCALSFLKESLLKSKTCSPFEFFDTLIERNLTYFLSCYGEETEDLLLEFLNILYGTQTKLGSSFKGCMNYMIATNKELKRSSFNKSMVRLMTCHASKGLQAPVVILADATVFPTLKNDLFLQAEDDQGKQILLLKSKVENDLPLTKTLKKKTLLALQQEHQRLLYVAMTRAQDQLYVTGIESAQKSWYHQIQIALTSFGITLDAELNLNLEIFPFEKEVRMNEFDLNARKNFSLFDLSTLSFSFSEPDDVSSVESAKKGSQLHLLLEYLGNTLTKDLCDLKKYCAFQKLDLIDQDIENLIQVKNKFPDLFSKNVCSEVGINCENGYRKIDRLVFFKTEIWIVDFKTHQKTRILTPYSLKKINKQLKEYKKAIGEIYPDQTIKTFVLWINDKELEEIK